MAPAPSAGRTLYQYRNPKIRQELPHLKNVFKKYSNQRSSISVYDYDQAWAPLDICHGTIRYPRPPDLADIFFSDHSDCKRRVVLIEDICQDLVYDLVELLDINPEFFENHLVGARLPNEESGEDNATKSGSHARDRYAGPEATEWTTRRLKRDFFSVKWYRPYVLNLGTDLVNISDRLVESRGKLYNERKFDCNVWRRHTHFQADGAAWSFEDGESNGLFGRTRLAYEERFTVWRGERQGVELIIALTDIGICGKLNDRQLSQQVSGRPQAYLVRRKDGKQQVMKSKVTRNVRPGQGEDTGGDIREKDALGDGDYSQQVRDGVLAAGAILTDHQSNDEDTDTNLVSPRHGHRRREQSSESFITQDLNARARARARSHSGSRSTREDARNGQIAHEEDPTRPNSEPSSSVATPLEPNDVRSFGRDAQAKRKSNQREKPPIRRRSQEQSNETALRTEVADTSSIKSFSLEKLFRLDAQAEDETPKSVGHNASQNAEDVNLPPLTSSTTPVQYVQASNSQAGSHHTHSPTASQIPLPRSFESSTESRPLPESVLNSAPAQSRASSVKTPWVLRNSRGNFTPVLQYRNNIVRNVASRCPVHNVTVDEARNQSYLRPLSSTREDIGEWLKYASLQLTDGRLPFGPVTMIYNIIHHDISDFLLLVGQYLDVITAAADDEIMLERNIVAWRLMLWFLGKELRSLSSSLPLFAMFLSGANEAHNAAKTRGVSKKMLKELTENISGTQKRLEVTFGTLVSSISVVEARKAISETESVTRLTELAFVYIPLSFAASFFGMQVKELDPSSTSISGFFGLGVGITLLSYSVRLLIRSENIKNIKRGFLDQVRIDSEISEGAPIRTRDALRLVIKRIVRPFTRAFHRFETPMLYIMLGLCPIIPMITVWTRIGLTDSMRLAVSIAFVIVILVMLLGWLVRYAVYRTSLLERRALSVPEEASSYGENSVEE